MAWKELERRLSGLPGADDAPVSRRKRRRPEPRDVSPDPTATTTPYAELHCHSHYSFLDGASSPGRAGRGGGAPGPARPGRHRPRRVLRRADAGRGRDRLAGCGAPHDLRRRALARSRRTAERRARPRGPPPAGAGPRGGGLPPAGGGDDGRAPAWATRRAVRSTTSTSSPSGAATTGWSSPAAARAGCARRWPPAVRARPPSSWTG